MISTEFGRKLRAFILVASRAKTSLSCKSLRSFDGLQLIFAATMRRSMSIVAVLLLTGCDSGGEPPQTPKPPYVKAHDINQLMVAIMQPQADVFWKSAGFISNSTGEHSLRPTTEAGWLATRSAAATVTEMGNLLMTPLYAEGHGEDWIQFSQSLVEIGKRAEKAAVDRDDDAIFEVGETMYNICSTCHQVFPPATTMPTATLPSSSKP